MLTGYLAPEEMQGEAPAGLNLIPGAGGERALQHPVTGQGRERGWQRDGRAGSGSSRPSPGLTFSSAGAPGGGQEGRGQAAQGRQPAPGHRVCRQHEGPATGAAREWFPMAFCLSGGFYQGCST